MIRSSGLHLHVVLLATFVALTLFLPACGGSAAPSSSSTADSVVGVVNGHVLHASDVAVVLAERRLIGQTPAEAFEEAVERELIRQEAARLGASVSTAVVNKRIADLTTQMGGAAPLKKLLATAKMTPAQLRRSIADGLLRENLQNLEYPGIVASPAAVRRYYVDHLAGGFTRAAAVHLGTILVRTRGIAENVLMRLAQHYTFAQVAEDFSVDPAGRSDGGDQGWVLMSSLPPSLAKAVRASKSSGIITRPIAGPGGWYVADMMAFRPAKVMPYSQVRARLSAELTRVKRARALEVWLAKARKAASIQEK